MYILDLILENILNSYCKPCLILYHKLLINIIIFITSFFYGLSFSRLYTFRFGILYQIWQMKKQLLIWRMLTGLHCQLRRNKIILLHLYFCTCFPGGGGGGMCAQFNVRNQQCLLGNQQCFVNECILLTLEIMYYFIRLKENIHRFGEY